MDAFDRLFIGQGAEVTASDAFEAGFARLALYAKGLSVTHACRQLPNGKWTSKLGRHVDIAHELRELEGPEYGSVVRIYRVRIIEERSLHR